MIDWLVTNALAALVLAGIAGVFIWTFRPAPAVRHALWLVVVLKLVAPGGPTVALPVREAPPPPKVAEAAIEMEDPLVEEEFFTVEIDRAGGQSREEATGLAMAALRRADEATDARTAPAVTPVPAAEPPPSEPFDYRPWLLGLWVAGAAYVGWRQVRETIRFARFARNARPAPDHLVAEVAVVAGRLGVRVPAVRVLAGLTSPVMWCLGRPVLLWPAGLECRLKGEGRRAVIAHELAHLRRRDHWVRRLEMVAAVLHWWNPLFWVARNKLRADAELACDAWAAGQADRRAYAEALLEVCSFNPRRRPAPAVGVFGEGRRAMQERLTMIMRDRVPCRLAFGAKLVVALMAVAAIPAWTLGQGKPKPQPVEEHEVVIRLVDTAEDGDGDDDAAAKAIEQQIRALAEKLAALKAGKRAGSEKKAAEKVQEAQEKVNEKLKELKFRVEKDGVAPKATTVTKDVKVLVSGQGGVKVIGPDGKEIKDAHVIIGGAGPGGAVHVVKPLTVGGGDNEKKAIELKLLGQDGQPKWVQGAVTAPAVAGQGGTARAVYGYTMRQGGDSITLSRATYKLSKDQAAALGTLLGSIKATVMETKVDGDSLTVTTTPDAQHTIGQIVRLISGQSGPARFEWKVAPDGGTQNFFTPKVQATPATPATPVKPAAPAKPAKPVGAKPAADEQPAKVNLNVILDQLKPAIKADVESDIDMAKLQELLKTLKPKAKPAGEKP